VQAPRERGITRGQLALERGITREQLDANAAFLVVVSRGFGSVSSLKVMETVFIRLNDGWNAEPNAPDAKVVVEGRDVLLHFDLNPFRFPQFHEGQRGHLRFTDAWRYRMGATNDEGWYRGQSRFSSVAPAWGEFYEVAGDLLLKPCPSDWQCITEEPGLRLRHFLFYLRDVTFECDARDYKLYLGSPIHAVPFQGAPSRHD
jgi:hypothetical protein